MVVGLVGYFLYRRSQGLDPRRAYRIEREQRPPDFAALGYKTAIVPIFGTDLNARALRRAAKLLGDDAVVYALYVLQVPRQLPLQGGMEAEEQQGRGAARERADRGAQGRRARQDRAHPHPQPRLRAGRRGAARQRRPDLPRRRPRPRSEQLLGPTTTYVLAKRRRIVVETGAATLADRAAGAGYPGPGGRTRDPHTTSTG